MRKGVNEEGILNSLEERVIIGLWILCIHIN